MTRSLESAKYFDDAVSRPRQQYVNWRSKLLILAFVGVCGLFMALQQNQMFSLFHTSQQRNLRKSMRTLSQLESAPLLFPNSFSGIESGSHLYSGKTNTDGEISVGVIVRTYRGHQMALESLVFSLAASAALANVEIFFTLLPTEEGDESFVNQVSERITRIARGMHIETYIPDASYYESSESICPPLSELNKFGEGSDKQSLAFWICGVEGKKCQKWLRKKISNGDPLVEQLYHRICIYDNASHYRMTDAALKKYLSIASHVLVTNGDNSYHPYFFNSLLGLNADIAASDFTHNRDLKHVKLEVGFIDLGGVLFNTRMLREMDVKGAFMTALGDHPMPRDYHNADFKLFQHIINGGGIFETTSDILYYHH